MSNKIVSQHIPEYIYSAIEKVGFEKRTYQTKAIINSLDILLNGNNVEINLPPGTGKTLISQIISCIWILEYFPNNKVLFILPSRILSKQHFEFFEKWAYFGTNLCNPVLISSQWANTKNIPHQETLRERNPWFTTPGIFANRIGKIIPYEILPLINLVIVDEYDAFTIGVMQSYGINQRFSIALSNLFEWFDVEKKNYLLLSATPIK